MEYRTARKTKDMSLYWHRVRGEYMSWSMGQPDKKGTYNYTSIESKGSTSHGVQDSQINKGHIIILV